MKIEDAFEIAGRHSEHLTGHDYAFKTYEDLVHFVRDWAAVAQDDYLRVVRLPAGAEPVTADRAFFVYDPEGGIEFHATDDARAKGHREAIAGYIDDGWGEGVEQVVSGIVTHRTVETDRTERPEPCQVHEDLDGLLCDACIEHGEYPDHSYDYCCSYVPQAQPLKLDAQAVWATLPGQAQGRTSPENVADVLDALFAHRARADAVHVKPAIHEVLDIVRSYGPYGEDINEGLRFQILLAEEVRRLAERRTDLRSRMHQAHSLGREIAKYYGQNTDHARQCIAISMGDFRRAADRAVEVQHSDHIDDIAVDRMAMLVRDKLKHTRENRGRGGWEHCGHKELGAMLRTHVDKGDPVDVAAFCAFLMFLELPIAATHKD